MIVNDEVTPGFWKNAPCGDAPRAPTEGFFCQKRAGEHHY